MRILIVFLFYLNCHVTLAQDGYQFLRLPASARIAALGGVGVSQADGDISVAFHNPAVLDSVQAGAFAVMWNPFLADINRYSAQFQVAFKKTGNIAFGVVNTQYGSFQARDASGNDAGTFDARDIVVYAGKAHTIGPFTLGMNLKFASLVLPFTRNSAILADIGGIYRHPVHQLTVGWVARHLGFRFGDTDLAGDIRPEVSVGATIKPQYMPFRFSLTAQDLGTKRAGEELLGQQISTAGNILSYINVGMAMILGKNLEVLAGYNQQRRNELRLPQGAYGAGLSMGFMFRVREMEFRYSRMAFHASGASNFIAIQGNFNTFRELF